MSSVSKASPHYFFIRSPHILPNAFPSLSSTTLPAYPPHYKPNPHTLTPSLTLTPTQRISSLLTLIPSLPLTLSRCALSPLTYNYPFQTRPHSPLTPLTISLSINSFLTPFPFFPLRFPSRYCLSSLYTF